jgi:membrane-associated phospholipid phosphatase
LNKRYLSVLVISSYLLSGIIVQILKYFIVEARPAVYLKDSTYQYFIENVTLHNYHAFPSGHTASAFAMATVFAVTKNNTWLSMLLLILAAMVGYSRIFLGQHFLVDVFGGAVVGVIAAIVCLCIFNPDNKFFKKRFRYSSSNPL